MKMELTNKERKYLGLELVNSSWERVVFPSSNGRCYEVILYFDLEEVIRKMIIIYPESYLECRVYIKTIENKTIIVPKTKRGKNKKLTVANLLNVNRIGAYFYFDGDVIIGNYTTQKTYYYSRLAGLPKMNEDELHIFLQKWIENTDPYEMMQIQNFAQEERRHCKFKEGDFFRFKIDRKLYGYGRVLFDVQKFQKNGGKFWNILFGVPILVSVYHIMTEDPNVSIYELEKLNSCPSKFIMDNCLYYGEYEIIGNIPLKENVDYPIMYGKSISAIDPEKIIYQRGIYYKEIPFSNNLIGDYDFKFNRIGFNLDITKNVLEECIKTNSNKPY